MSLDAVLPLFEQLEAEERAAAEAAEREQRRRDGERLVHWQWMRDPMRCLHCGVWERNYWDWERNHGLPNPLLNENRDAEEVVVGWCRRRRMNFQAARQAYGVEARAWLAERGFALPTVEQRWGDWGDK